jgi:RNA polymerase sigma-70 factor (ECF subfamily)
MGADYKTYDDRELISLLAGGAEPALQELFDRYWESLFAKAYHFLDSEAAAKDCVQEVFIWLWQHRGTLAIENVKNYLHQAARFQALKALREQKAAKGFEHRLKQLTSSILQENTLEFKELKNLLESLIASLPEDQQLIFRLHREEALTYRQIADKLNISVKTVEKKMSLSLRYLRRHANGSPLLVLFFYFIS